MSSQQSEIAVELAEQLTMKNVKEFHTEILAKLSDSTNSLVINGEQNDVVDFSALQTLVALFAEATKQGIIIRWHKPSEAIAQQAEELGLSQALHLH